MKQKTTRKSNRTKKLKTTFEYLATPYTHPDSSVRTGRYMLAAKYAAIFMSQGRNIFCPITHSHPITTYGKLKALDPEFWKKQDAAFLNTCSKLIVIKMWGWDMSEGVQHEIKVATQRGIPIEYVEDTLLDDIL